jgi:hypothetical protein
MKTSNRRGALILLAITELLMMKVSRRFGRSTGS